MFNEIHFSFFDFFFIDLLFVKFLVTSTGDAAFTHLGIVMDVGVGKAASFHKENLHA